MLPKVLATLFAARFKEAREKKNVTIKALLPKVGASSSAMNGYATGKTLPPLDVACKIAQELDVSLDWLCGLRASSAVELTIDTCADAAAAIDQIVDKFAHVDMYTEIIDDAPDGFLPEPNYWVTLRVDSKALYEYYKQLESTMEYQKNLPANMREGFMRYKEAAVKQLREQLEEADITEDGMKLPF